MRALVLLLLAGATAAQETPRIGYAYPAGAGRGAAVEVEVGGTFLRNTQAAWFSGAGVTAVVQRCIYPLSNEERDLLRQEEKRLAAAQKAAPLDAADAARLAAIRQQLAAEPRRQAVPQLAESAVLLVTVADDAATGVRDLRLCTASGLSNPLRFHVGAEGEQRETEPNDQRADACTAALPAVVNGQILPGDQDRFRLHLEARQRLCANVRARALIPYLADAVPGWFQAVLTLRDDQGREVAFADDNLFDPDPQLVYDVPLDGDYELEVRDALYRGREDFVYRLELRALTAASAAATTATAPPLGPFAPVLEREPDDHKESAQALQLPCVVVGRVARPGDVDVYAIDGHFGQALVLEMIARRIGSPCDGLLQLLGPDGREVARSDDRDDPGSGLVTHQADPFIQCRLPTQGRYLLLVRDLQGKGGAEFTYRLRLGPPLPDFSVYTLPSAINVRAGATAVLTVQALRHDGFDGEIRLSLRQAPPGFRLGGGVIPAGLKSVQVTVTTPADAAPATVRLGIDGVATIAGAAVRRAAIAADDRMQAFIWHHLVPADELLAGVLPGGPGLGPIALAAEAPLLLRAGGTAEASFDLADARHLLPGGMRCRLVDAPQGITVVATRIKHEGFVVVLAADKSATRGLAGNLILEAVFAAPAGSGQDGAAKKNVSLLLPAVRFAVAKR